MNTHKILNLKIVIIVRTYTQNLTQNTLKCLIVIKNGQQILKSSKNKYI